jgi:hypothetical protein
MSRTASFPPRDLVLLVGGDDAAARSCARAASPVPVLRAQRLAIATQRLRSMRPIALVLAPDVSEADVAELTRIAGEQAAPVVRLDLELPVGALLRSVARS